MARKPKITNKKNAKPLKIKQGKVQIKNLSFSYDGGDTNALKKINLNVAGGGKVALVGPSGAGKSTCFGLLLRFYNLQSGQIVIDGQDISAVTIDSLRRNIALVSQEHGIFNDTIAANIAFGDEDIDEEKLIRAAQMADADNFINRLPKKYQTLAGENGNRLSGGQRQRLAIARALYKDAPILLLDEATSALDPQTEKKIQKGLKQLMKNRTVIIIAHRLSTVQDADCIYVFDHGKILESGKHKELLAKNGLYALLYRQGDELH